MAHEPTAALCGVRDPYGLGATASAESVLHEAGFCIRHLQSALYGPIPKGEELLAVLRTAELLVLDFSDNLPAAEEHHRFAIAAGRGEKNTLVLSPARKPRAGETPFTQILYRGNADLEKQLRRFLGISEPIFKDHFARQLAFHGAPEVFGLADVFVARAILGALRLLRFSGRAEAYTVVDRAFETPKYFFALGVKEHGSRRQPKAAWWMKLQAEVGAALAAQDAGVVLAEKSCRSAEVWKFRSAFREDGVVEFQDGLPVRVLHPRRATFWFELAALSSIHGELPSLPEKSISRPASDLR